MSLMEGTRVGKHRLAGRNGKLYKGISGSAAAVLAMAALTASQGQEPAPETAAPVSGPGGQAPAEDPGARADAAPAPAPEAGPQPETGEGLSLPYHTDLPPLDTIGHRVERTSRQIADPGAPQHSQTLDAAASASGIPVTVLDAYHQAAALLRDTTPGCGLRWEVLAAIGKVESGHAAGGAVDAEGTTFQPILGPVLNGDGFAQILDTDGGQWDADAVYDRAVGPMQFIPSTWANWGADANGDGRADPNNVYDAALAAGDYLCAGGRDLADGDGLNSGLLSYNHSWDYVRTVRAWLDYYLQGVQEVPDGEGPLPTSPGAGNPDGGGQGPAASQDGQGGQNGQNGQQASNPSRPEQQPSGQGGGQGGEGQQDDAPEEPDGPDEPDEPSPGPAGGDEPDAPEDPGTSPSQPSEPPQDPDEPAEPAEPEEPGDAPGLTDLTDALGLTGLTDGLGLTDSDGTSGG
jgi:membrane-bound lytic murein transglycosylase B